MISIDGYRYDYNQLHKPKWLNEFADGAAKVERLKPIYPSKTFPNHLSLVTGLYADHHGIIANRFYSPTLEKHYKISDKSAVTDGRFYQGVPIWSLAESQGKKTAIYFWPGSEALIAGQRPTEFKAYVHHQDFEQRINQVVDWLSTPNTTEFVALYFHEVDSAGHKFGPSAAETRQAVHKVDAAIAKLDALLKAKGIEVNLIITSDHGMVDSSQFELLNLDGFIPKHVKAQFKFVGSGPFINVYHQGMDKQADIKALLQTLAGVEGLQALAREDIPASLHYSDIPAIGDVLIKTESLYLGFTGYRPPSKGEHGYHVDHVPEMATMLMARGPNFSDKTVKEALNIHVYPMLAELLGLKIEHQIDGKLEVLQPLIKQN
ncbi:ectonucleotide pyrophosphatase/phosphodiesterase [Paraferrimonas sp. SM1919]|uniref:alkaline phosphatase family protein n=1 Tax=Paraferrimonas sp. SM1919 TaxID=2662263 RepID=UPI001F09B275|nr:ectonucleotide pyrophosphatase/phosphodiesterase [Paraferrimonas sp. SM1919]